MHITLQNQYLQATIHAKGAELKSLVNRETGFEHIWQANPDVWASSAPVLFPIVGEVTDNTLTVEGKKYEIQRHGFARRSVFTLTRQSDEEVVFTLHANDETLQHYPFLFAFSVGYRLEGRKLITTFTVENTGTHTMYFSVGAHPGFNLPTQHLEDYYLEFEKPETTARHLLKNNVFSGETEPVLKDSNILPLNTSYFDKDAIVFKDLKSRAVSLKSNTDDFKITMYYEGFPYFGIWTKPGNQQYICLEPWCGYADTANFSGELKDKEAITSLEAKEVFERAFAVQP